MPIRPNAFIPVLILFFSQHTGAFAQPAGPDSYSIHFAFGKKEISQLEKDQFAEYIENHWIGIPTIDSVLFIGGTDPVGKAGSNFRLSLQRAEAAEHLFEKKVPDSKMVKLILLGQGAGNAIPGDDSASRRVEIRIYYKRPGQTNRLGKEKRKPDSLTSTDLRTDTTFIMQNILFVEDKAILTPASRFKLPEYIRILKHFTNNIIEIRGYCNSQTKISSSSDPLFILSVNRAKLIYEYLIEAGFDENRLRYRGMGNTSSVKYAPSTDEEKRENMRVEISIYSNDRREKSDSASALLLR